MTRPVQLLRHDAYNCTITSAWRVQFYYYGWNQACWWPIRFGNFDIVMIMIMIIIIIIIIIIIVIIVIIIVGTVIIITVTTIASTKLMLLLELLGCLCPVPSNRNRDKSCRLVSSKFTPFSNFNACSICFNFFFFLRHFETSNHWIPHAF